MEHPLSFKPDQKTILVVDDQETILSSVSAFLNAGKYNVITANSGELALQKSKDYKGDIHLLLTDFQMPEMDGIQLATAMSIDRPQLKGAHDVGFHWRNARAQRGMAFLTEGLHLIATARASRGSCLPRSEVAIFKVPGSFSV